MMAVESHFYGHFILKECDIFKSIIVKRKNRIVLFVNYLTIFKIQILEDTNTKYLPDMNDIVHPFDKLH
jgi:hypothetical protein